MMRLQGLRSGLEYVAIHPGNSKGNSARPLAEFVYLEKVAEGMCDQAMHRIGVRVRTNHINLWEEGESSS